MKHLLTIISCCLVLSLSAQTDWPWNPDSDNDGLIGTIDLLDLLTVFNSEFVLPVPENEQYTLALANMGAMPYWKCEGACYKVGGHVMYLKEMACFADSLFIDVMAPAYNGSFEFSCNDGSTVTAELGEIHLNQSDPLGIFYWSSGWTSAIACEGYTFNTGVGISASGSVTIMSNRGCICAGKILNPLYIE
jgi:hypothetical protein